MQEQLLWEMPVLFGQDTPDDAALSECEELGKKLV